MQRWEEKWPGLSALKLDRLYQRRQGHCAMPSTLSTARNHTSLFAAFAVFQRNGFVSKAMRLNEVDDIQSGSSSSPEFTREEFEHFQALKEAQTPKFMVIACADSRVCPAILEFRPGEAFMIRNVANLVPPLENGPLETNAALEFAVENILIIRHSCCEGIQTLTSMQDNGDSSFIKTWATNGKIAKNRTESAANHLNFDKKKCRICEKEYINRSLLNLLTYPWIEERVKKELLFVHGGYYDFLNCTFEDA